ncbi:MAG: (2Fe-2S)-binding protein [Pseudomonadales bacterium]
MYVCLCKAVTDHEVRDAIEAGATSTEELSERLGVGTGCGCCKEMTAQIVDEQLARDNSYAA